MTRIICLVVTTLASFPILAADPVWSGRGQFRVLVRVEPVEIGARQSDELVAKFPIDFEALLKSRSVPGFADLATIQVHQFEIATGTPKQFKTFDSSSSDFDRPCRFEDDAVPEDFPDRLARASVAPNGRGPALTRKRGGRLFNREMDATRGAITWVHTQSGRDPAHYAIYFDVKSSVRECGPSPAPWIGDADVLRLKEGQHLSGLSHSNICAGDFKGDGLFDLLAGAEKGNLVWYPNHGTQSQPKFVALRGI